MVAFAENTIDFKVSYFDSMGNIAFEEEFYEFGIIAARWNFVGDYNSDNIISVEVTMKQYFYNTKRKWVL